LLRFRNGRRLGVGRRRFGFGRLTFQRFRLALGRLGLDPALDILPSAVLPCRLDVFGNRHRLTPFRQIISGQEDLHRLAKDLQFNRDDQQDGVQQQAQQDGQLHAAAKGAIVDQGQRHGSAAV
jgi:hypothetical protein